MQATNYSFAVSRSVYWTNHTKCNKIFNYLSASFTNFKAITLILRAVSKVVADSGEYHFISEFF